MKIIYNSLRKSEYCDWVKRNSKYMVNKEQNTTSKFSLFLGSYVYMALMENMFPNIPFQAVANPRILTSSINKEAEYSNENIEIIYVLRLCNAIFVLVCWKEECFSPSLEA